jgi:glycosyltransferase involved in cell wall biosynthesis
MGWYGRGRGSSSEPTSARTVRPPLRVVLADPAAFTPQYDHELAAALARAGAEVELVTSRFRFGETPAPAGYARREVFYPLSSRLFRRSRLRLPLKAAEHPFGMARLALGRPDVLHVQWLAAPQPDRLLFRSRVPAVFTAHDLLPRRTAHREELWRRLLRRFDRIVVHSERGRETLAGLGVDPERLRVIAHPAFRSDPDRTDDGQTVLCLGAIRPYKGLGDAIAAVARVDGARLLVAGDPLEPLDAYRAAAADRAEWRLGYLAETELDRALGDATIAAFPYRAELDQSGALMRVLGAGVPAVVYDVGGLAEPIRTFGAGLVVPAGNVEALTEAIRGLLGDPAALAEARAGALRAREELTWDASAAAHLDVYRELV